MRQGKGKRRPRTQSATRRERYPAELSVHLRSKTALFQVTGKGAYRRGQQSLCSLTMVERTSRYVILAKFDTPTADAAAQAITRDMSRKAPSLLKTMTHDHDSGMARHAEITAHAGMKIYFVYLHSPWQRCSNENTNGLLRQYLPKGTDLSLVIRERLDEIAEMLNTRLRQTLGWSFWSKYWLITFSY